MQSLPSGCQRRRILGEEKLSILREEGIAAKVTLFGESLPADAWTMHREVQSSDLLMVIGTSLEVYRSMRYQRWREEDGFYQ